MFKYYFIRLYVLLTTLQWFTIALRIKYQHNMVSEALQDQFPDYSFQSPLIPLSSCSGHVSHTIPQILHQFLVFLP